MRLALSRILTIGLIAAIAVIGSIAGRAVWEGVTAQDKPLALSPSQEALSEESAAAKFEGELLGIYIIDANDSDAAARVPDKFVTGKEVCGSQRTEQVSWDRAGEFGLTISLPEPFRLVPDSLNTGVIACGSTVYAARWEYSALLASGYPGSLIIARSPFKYVQFGAPAQRVHATEIGGLPAVYIEPLIPSGIGSAALVVFPGDAVITEITSSGIPDADLLKVAEIVGAAIAEEH